MKRPFVKKTAKINNTNIRNWAQTLKDAESHFTKCVKYCKNVKRLLKNIDKCKPNNQKDAKLKRSYIDAIQEELKNVKSSADRVYEKHDNIFNLINQSSDSSFQDTFSSYLSKV